MKFARWLGVLTLVVLLVTRLAPTPALAAPSELFFSEYVEGSSNINLNASPLYDVVHVNAEFATQARDRKSTRLNSSH